VLPYELVDDLPNQEPMLDALRREIQDSGNPVMFPNTSIYNEDWENWKPWYRRSRGPSVRLETWNIIVRDGKFL
jgi:hypothetical protein